MAGAITYVLVRPHPGSGKNDLMHITLWGCILFGMALRALDRLPDRRAAATARCTALLLCAVQLGLLLYDPRSTIPCPGSEEKGREFIAMVDDTSYYTWLGQRVPFDNVALLLASREPLARAIEGKYRIAGRMPYRHVDEFRNPTGFLTRPEIILVPNIEM